jgi:hypothetical protein
MAAQSACQRVSIENAMLGSVTFSCNVAEHVPIRCREYLPDNESADVAVVLGYALNRSATSQNTQ